VRQKNIDLAIDLTLFAQGPAVASTNSSRNGKPEALRARGSLCSPQTMNDADHYDQVFEGCGEIKNEKRC
jgi:hypothetical protein